MLGSLQIGNTVVIDLLGTRCPQVRNGRWPDPTAPVIVDP
jgi:hypothetical protein